MNVKIKKNLGFTLVELMVVVAIVGIIGTIAMSSYSESQFKSRRTIAQGGLKELATVMESYYLEHGLKYNDPDDPSVDSSGKPLIFTHEYPLNKGPYYKLWVLDLSAGQYVLVAEPINAQASDGILILTSTGLKGWDEDNSLNGNKASYGNLSPTELDWNKG